MGFFKLLWCDYASTAINKSPSTCHSRWSTSCCYHKRPQLITSISKGLPCDKRLTLTLADGKMFIDRGQTNSLLWIVRLIVPIRQNSGFIKTIGACVLRRSSHHDKAVMVNPLACGLSPNHSTSYMVSKHVRRFSCSACSVKLVIGFAILAKRLSGYSSTLIQSWSVPTMCLWSLSGDALSNSFHSVYL